MNNTDRINLDRMIRENDVEDCTEEIRRKRHSELIRTDVTKLLDLKTTYAQLIETNVDEFDNMIASQCNFLFTNYTDIFNKVNKNEINLLTLWELLNVLRKIEDNDLNQQEGSYEIGKLLKQIYIDGALIKAERLDKINNTIPEQKLVSKEISWKEYKIKECIVKL